jgi:hypothetical protein
MGLTLRSRYDSVGQVDVVAGCVQCKSEHLYTAGAPAPTQPMLVCNASCNLPCIFFVLQQYLEQIKADPEVCAISGQPPPAKKQRTTPAPSGASLCVGSRMGCCLWAVSVLLCEGSSMG